MSVLNCIDSAVQQGAISFESGRDLKQRYRLMVAQHGSAEAQRRLAEEIAAQAFQKRRETVLREQRVQAIVADLAAYRDERGRPDIARALAGLIEHHGEGEGFAFSSVQGRYVSIAANTMKDIEELLNEFRTSAILGRRMNRPRLDNVVAELFDEDTGDAAARAIANAVRIAFEDLRQRFNAAGGAIAKRDDYGLPQHHNARTIGKADTDEWANFLIDLLAPERMRHPLTGRPMTRAEVLQMLPEIRRRIVSDGWIDTNPLDMTSGGRGALYKHHQEHRFLVFKDAQSWLAYQRRFGAGDPYAAIVNHILSMSREIAMLEVLGPNPDLMLDTLKKWVLHNANVLISSEALDNMPEQLLPLKGQRWITDPVTGERTLQDPREVVNRGSVQDRLQSYVKGRLKQVDDMYAQFRGDANIPVSTGAAAFMSGARNLIVASSLGSGYLSAVATDPMMQITARRFIGLGGEGMVLPRIIEGMRPMREREAHRAGIIHAEALRAYDMHARWLGSLTGPEWTKWLADRVLTWSLLTPHTNSARRVVGREIQAYWADQLENAFTALPEPMQRYFRRYGVTADDWEFARRAALLANDGDVPDFLLPQDIMAGAERLGDELRGRQVAERLLEMILMETEHFVPSGTLATRAFWQSDTKPGTFVGEVMRSAGQFKSFGLTVVWTYIGRITSEALAGRPLSMVTLAAVGMIALTIGGAMSRHLKSIAAGKDPEPMDDMKFWFASMLQGGGFGIFGDFILADTNRFGGSLTSTAAGPLAGRIERLLMFAPGNLKEALQGDKTNAGREAVRLAREWTPAMSTLWYAKLAVNRQIWDELQKHLDPQAPRAFRTQVQNARRDNRQEFFWPPGSPRPTRGPDFRPMMGQR